MLLVGRTLRRTLHDIDGIHTDRVSESLEEWVNLHVSPKLHVSLVEQALSDKDVDAAIVPIDGFALC